MNKSLARAFAGLSCAACLACNSVLGASDYTIAEAAGGSGGEAGASGEAGAAGGAGTAGSGGCGSVVSPDAKTLRACVLSVSCSPFYPTRSISYCVTNDYLAAYPDLACKKAAATCGDIEVCEGEGYYTGGVCSGTSEKWRCDGDRAVRCSASAPYFVDCGQRGATCATLPAGSDLSYFPCVVAPSCTGTGSTCSGSVLSTCVGGVGYGLDCALSKATCAPDAKGEPGCFYKLPTCSDTGTNTCEGAVSRTCTSSGGTLAFDCGTSGFSCKEEAGSTYCLASGCQPGDAKACKADTCSGSKMTLCLGGAPYTIDCKDYGFSSCIDDKSDTGLVYAHCG